MKYFREQIHFSCFFLRHMENLHTFHQIAFDVVTKYFTRIILNDDDDVERRRKDNLDTSLIICGEKISILRASNSSQTSS